MSKCIHCAQALNKSIFRNNKTLKSCPNCSINNGSEHVFYEYPKYFGTTPLRSSTNNPEGPQSHCTICRGNSENYPKATLCHQL